MQEDVDFLLFEEISNAKQSMDNNNPNDEFENNENKKFKKMIDNAELPTPITNWLECRMELVKKTEETIALLNKCHLDVDKAKIAGTSASITGSVIGITGTILLFTPFAYVGVPLTIAGGVLGATGVGTYAGSSITEWGIGKKHRAQIQKLLDRDHILYCEMADYLAKLSEDEKFEEGTFAITIGDLYIITSVGSFMKCIVKDLSITPIIAIKDFIRAMRASTIAVDAAEAGGKAATISAIGYRSMSTFSMLSVIAGGVVSALLIPVDVYFLYEASNDLWNEGKPELSKVLLQFLDTISKPLVHIAQMHDPSLTEESALEFISILLLNSKLKSSSSLSLNSNLANNINNNADPYSSFISSSPSPAPTFSELPVVASADDDHSSFFQRTRSSLSGIFRRNSSIQPPSSIINDIEMTPLSSSSSSSSTSFACSNDDEQSPLVSGGGNNNNIADKSASASSSSQTERERGYFSRFKKKISKSKISASTSNIKNGDNNDNNNDNNNRNSNVNESSFSKLYSNVITSVLPKDTSNTVMVVEEGNKNTAENLHTNNQNVIGNEETVLILNNNNNNNNSSNNQSNEAESKNSIFSYLNPFSYSSPLAKKESNQQGKENVFVVEEYNGEDKQPIINSKSDNS